MFAEDAQTIVSDYTSFSSIDYTRNTQLSTNNHLNGYDTSEFYINFDVIEDLYNTIYEADLNFDGEVDYKQEIDVDKDGRIDITKYGIMNSSGDNIIWYRIIQDYEYIENDIKEEVSPEKRTRWFSLDYKVWGDYNGYAQRGVQETTYTNHTSRTVLYAVTIDNDFFNKGNAIVR